MLFKQTIISLAVAGLIASSALAEEQVSTLDEQKNLAVTIYNTNLALVKDTRDVSLQKGLNLLAFKDVSAMIRPETALLRNLSHSKGFSILEQNFDFDLLTPQKLLEKYVGKQVTIIKTHPTTGEETAEQATVLATNNGVVLRFKDRIETGLPGRIAFDAIPQNLRDRPTLVMQMTSGRNDRQTLELSYLTSGLSWKADYVAEIDKDDTKLDLAGWVTLTNQSGTSYNNAQLQLVAGDVNRVREEFKAMGRAKMDVAMAEAPRPQMSEESLFEYHLYTLGRKTTIAQNQTKQVSLLTAQQVPIVKELVLMGNNYYYMNSVGDIGQKMKVGAYIHFDNEKKHNLGLALPKGIVRVYKKDKSGNAQFIGEDRIDHTPDKETIRLKLGDSFDVTADKKQTEFKKVSGFSPYSYVYTATFKITLKNAKKEKQQVTVREPIPGDWDMLEETHKHDKVTAHTAEWKITIPPKDKVELVYKVRVKY